MIIPITRYMYTTEKLISIYNPIKARSTSAETNFFTVYQLKKPPYASTRSPECKSLENLDSWYEDINREIPVLNASL